MILSIALAVSAVCANPQTQAEMNQCAAADFASADKALNAVWPKVRGVMQARDKATGKPTDGRPGYYAALLDAQRAWLRYRDGQCQVAGYSMRGGSAEPMVVSGCKAKLTQARVAELKALAGEFGR